jgi:hypothetical protein
MTTVAVDGFNCRCGGHILASPGHLGQQRLSQIKSAAMKNHFEMYGKACRVVFDPSTDQFITEELVHPFLGSKPEPVVPKAGSLTVLSDKRRSTPFAVSKAVKQRRLG